MTAFFRLHMGKVVEQREHPKPQFLRAVQVVLKLEEDEDKWNLTKQMVRA